MNSSSPSLLENWAIVSEIEEGFAVGNGDTLVILYPDGDVEVSSEDGAISRLPFQELVLVLNWLALHRLPPKA